MKSSDLHDVNVETCITKNIQRWRFPVRRDHSTVQVNNRLVFISE